MKNNYHIDSEGEELINRAKAFTLQAGKEGVLLVHGFSGTIDTLRPLGNYLFSQGYTVHGVRLAGHGENVDALAETNVNDWLESVRQGIIELKKICDDITIVGDSMGGNLALKICLENKEINKLILLGTPIQVHGQWWKQIFIPLITPFKKYYNKSWVKNDDQRREHVESGSYLKVSLKAFISAMKLFNQTKKVVPQVTLPVLMIYSKKDEVIKPDSADYIFKNLGSKNKKLFWITDSVHHPQDSAKREQIYSKIYHFLKSNI
ncbi:alpha/beta hydrolase [Patescibacteria group bacterium]